MAKAKTGTKAILDLFTPKGKSSGALPSSAKIPEYDIAMSKYLSNEKLSKAESELLGLYHPAGGGVKLSKMPSEYTAEYDMPRELSPSKVITPESMLGSASIPLVGDSADAGKRLIAVNGLPLSGDVNLEGGSRFMRDNPDAWASGQGVVTVLNNQIERALQGVDKVYGPHVSMSGTGGDFNTMTTKTLLNMFDPTDLPEEAAQLFDNRVRTTPVKNQKTGEIRYPYADFVGIQHPELRDQLLSKKEGTGNLRKAFVETMNKAEFQKMGFPEPAAARFATSDPVLINKPIGSTGYEIAEFTPGERVITNPLVPHETYPVHIKGEHAGSLADTVPAEVYFKDYFNERRLLGSPKSSDTRAFTMSSPIQYHDQAWLDNIMGFITARDKKIKTGEYADGGMVETPAQEAIADTVRNPNAARMLEMDLANLALMNQQPQKMAKGGLGRKLGKLLPTPKVNEVAPTQYELAHKLAQEHAALPIEQGGLGLPPDNTAMDRAKAMGFDIEAYHGTINPEIMAFDPMSGKGAREGTGSWFSENPQLASTYAGNMGGTIMPVLIKDRKFAVVDAEGKNWARLTPDTAIYHSNRTDTPASDLIENLFHDYTTTNDIARFAKREGDKGVRFFNIKDQGARMRGVEDVPETADNLTVFDPTMVRGRFAAFDPFESGSPDIMKAKGGVVKMAEGGEVSQAELDRMRLELNSPVIQATPQSPIQRGIGTIGGYMDRAGQFVSKSLEPIAESHPVKHFLGEMLLADTLKSAGTALQDYTKTSREITEDQPYRRAPITGSGQTMSLDPRMLDVVGFADPVTRLGIKAGRAGVKAATPFAKDAAEMASELYMKGDVPFMPSPNMYAVSPDGKPSKVLAPANEIGFYSPTEAAALNLQRKSGAGQAFLNDIMKGENVRADEIKTMGLDTFLKDKKNVTADEVRDYIAQNKIQLGESVYGYRKPPEVKPQSPEDFLRFENLGEEIDSARNFEAETKAPKFESYAIPGGENYREIVLTLPEPAPRAKTVDEAFELWKQDARAGKRGQYSPEEIDSMQLDNILDILKDEYMTPSKKGVYKSSHWDEPNPLAHLRVSDRVTDGKKTLLVDEVQSDWHQQGRDRGYVSPDDKSPAQLEKELTAVTSKRSQLIEEAAALPDSELDKFLVLNNQIKQLGEQATQLNRQWTDSLNSPKKVPDAPYKDDWYQLTLRRAIKEAIDGGYDRVALPTGSRVAERFDLSQQIDRIDYNKNDDGTYSMSAVKDGREVFAKEDLDEKELSGIVGKDVAKKIVGDEGSSAPKADRWEAEDGDEPEFKSLSGLDLSVGGEGMKKYYDEVYPNYLKKFGKKYGAEVGDTKLLLPIPKMNKPTGWGGDQYMKGEISLEEYLKLNPDVAKKYTETLHYMDITPAMRKEFSTGIPMKRGGKVQFAKSLDAMRHELTKAK